MKKVTFHPVVQRLEYDDGGYERSCTECTSPVTVYEWNEYVDVIETGRRGAFIILDSDSSDSEVEKVTTKSPPLQNKDPAVLWKVVRRFFQK